MYQAGEVDYLVATDAIGMGLNMDVGHVAFAGLTKFDGRRQRRLTVRRNGADRRPRRPPPARRHVRLAALERRAAARSRPRRSLAIEEHRFPPLDHLYWREGEPDLSQRRRADRQPRDAAARAACCAPRREAIDLAVLKRLAEDAWVRDRARCAGDGRAAVGGVRPARFPQDSASIRMRASSRGCSAI